MKCRDSLGGRLVQMGPECQAANDTGDLEAERDFDKQTRTARRWLAYDCPCQAHAPNPIHRTWAHLSTRVTSIIESVAQIDWHSSIAARHDRVVQGFTSGWSYLFCNPRAWVSSAGASVLLAAEAKLLKGK
jgi:hypothetical protein